MSTWKYILLSALCSTLVAHQAKADGYVDDDHTAMHGAAGAAPTIQANSNNTGASRMPSSAGPGIESVSQERSSQAVGHYARARSLLIAALREFDQGYSIANPDALFDSRAWRGDLMSRAQELERVLDPQPRIGRSGIKYGADTRLLTDPVRGK